MEEKELLEQIIRTLEIIEIKLHLIFVVIIAIVVLLVAQG